MKYFRAIFFLNLLLFMPLWSGEPPQEPVTPNASPEAKALLNLFYSISGDYTLTGQHNYPNTKDRNSQFAAKYIGEMPAIWSSDMGFAKAGDKDSYLARPEIVKEAIRQYRLGSLVTLCWHAVPPTADEPVTFQSPRGSDSTKLESVQGDLLDEQFRDVLTPGTELYKKWEAQVDTVAFYLKKLRDAHVPVLWRPYHEMNGSWFWWGGRTDEPTTKALYKQLFDRYTKVHKLNNLIWLWSVDRAHSPEMQYSKYYPGNDYLDIVSLDVYGSDFSEAYYDSLKALRHGKPMVLGEVGNPPTLEVLQQQPLWSYWVVWAGMVRNTTKAEYQQYVDSNRVLFLDDPTYWQLMSPLRQTSDLPPLPMKEGPTNFSGTWLFSEQDSDLGNAGVGNVPYKMSISQNGDELVRKDFYIVEWDDDRVSTDTLKLDGTEMKSQVFNAPRITTATWSENGDTLVIASATKFSRGGRTFEMSSTEKWALEKRGTVLSINQSSTSFRGERNMTLIYKKQ